jgi:hypothetical protein
MSVDATDAVSADAEPPRTIRRTVPAAIAAGAVVVGALMVVVGSITATSSPPPSGPRSGALGISVVDVDTDTATATATGADADAVIPHQGRLASAYHTCPAPHYGVSLGDGGTSIIVDFKSELEAAIIFLALEDPDTSEYGAACVLKRLGLPEYLREQIENTNALMGRQRAEADGLAYEWSYHPESGLSMTITEVGAPTGGAF